MSVVVFGGPGGVGTLIVGGLLSDGYAVTADLRNPAKVPDRWAPKVRVIVGELANATSVDSGVQGAGGVVSALGQPSAEGRPGSL
jgi:uncharacterized protein YbjT (DUF2867 family)